MQIIPANKAGTPQLSVQLNQGVVIDVGLGEARRGAMAVMGVVCCVVLCCVVLCCVVLCCVVLCCVVVCCCAVVCCVVLCCVEVWCGVVVWFGLVWFVLLCVAVCCCVLLLLFLLCVCMCTINIRVVTADFNMLHRPVILKKYDGLVSILLQVCLFEHCIAPPYQ